jgi:hypothetical protein
VAAAHPGTLLAFESLRLGTGLLPLAGGNWAGSSVDPGKQLTGTIMGAFMSYVLVPHEHDVTRLLLKVVLQTTRWTALGLCVGDLITARRQLLNFKQLAESHQHQITAFGLAP